MVNNMRQDKARNLLKEVNKLKHKHNSTPSSMDIIVEPREVAQLFKNKFEMIYSSNPTTNDELRQIENKVNSRIKLYDQDQVSVVTVQNVKDAVSALKTRKSDGMLGLHTDHIINAPVSCYVILSLLFSSMLVHGYVPDELLRSTIVPIPKNNLGNLCSSENYRGIALCNPILKLFECIIYKARCCSLTTYENQFAFKECHSPVTCTVVLKETVTYYRERNTKVYACLVDATKAFDHLK